mmetsp:Transcript_9172/g.13825  ORF Transcript_9172/g.13825 Transcript_9172/m.13825 type:complete len:428 (-) Transcript_9172:123-1406(-)
MSMSQAQAEIKSLLLKARDLAAVACHYDEDGELVKASQSYDESIIYIDEVLGKIPSSCDAWQLLMIYREKYNTRMEKIRYIEMSQRDTSGMSPPKLKRRMSKVPFNDKLSPIELKAPPREDPPQSLLRRPYWLLRVLGRVIEKGGYISSRVYVPKLVWSQFGVKFSGLGVKTAAFENLAIYTTAHIRANELPMDATTTRVALYALKRFRHELVGIQNNLAKPLPYIKEVSLNEAPSPPPSSNVGRLSSMVTSLGKNVVKYAEVGYQRMTSLPVRMGDDELTRFAQLAAHLCDQCQILDGWTNYVEDELEALQSSRGCAATVSFPTSSNSLDTLRPKETQPSADFPAAPPPSPAGYEAHTHDSPHSDAHRLSAMQELYVELTAVSVFFKEVICEILLRDNEYLLDRYMRKMRKSFSRMYWDDEAGDDK